MIHSQISAMITSIAQTEQKKSFEYMTPNKIKCTLTALDETENNLVSMGHTQQTRGQEDMSYEHEQEEMDQNLGMGQTQETKIWVIAQ